MESWIVAFVVCRLTLLHLAESFAVRTLHKSRGLLNSADSASRGIDSVDTASHGFKQHTNNRHK